MHNIPGMIVASTLLISGCATPPRWLADHYNSQDPCQARGRVNYSLPNFCGAAGAHPPQVIRDSQGRVLGTIR